MPERKRARFGRRHLIAGMSFMGMACSYTMRLNLSMAIVAMVNSTKPSTHNHSAIQGSTCPFDDTEKSEEQEGEYNWDEGTKGLVLGSFFWGYAATQLPGGLGAMYIGGRHLFGYGMLVTALLTLLTPAVVPLGPEAVMVLRLLEGLGEGVTMPAMLAVLAKWIPPLERGLLVALVIAGCQFGNVIAMSVSGMLNASAIGWPLVFYVFGVTGTIWCICWILFSAESPETDKRISEEELDYILTSLNKKNQPTKARPDVPWKEIFTSRPVWALIVAQTGNAYGMYTLMTILPTYMKEVLHFDMKSNGVISSLPYLVNLLLANPLGYLADFLCRKKYLTVTKARKIFASVGMLVPAVCFVGASYTGCNRGATVFLVTISFGINSAINSGISANHMDLSPVFTGILFGISNTGANISGFAAPFVAGLVVKDQTLEEWRIVFYIAALVYIVSVVTFALFSSAHKQPFDASPRYSGDDEPKGKKETEGTEQGDSPAPLTNIEPSGTEQEELVDEQPEFNLD